MQITDFKILLECIDRLDEKSLVVFDIDDTLIVAKDKILCSCGESYLDALSAQLDKKLSPEIQIELQSLALLQREINHTDSHLTSLFQKLKKNNVAFMALTAMPTGKFGLIPSLEQWRNEELRRYGIDFESHSPYKGELSFDEFGNSPPLFYKGMLFTINHAKGESLKAFLLKTDVRPSQIIFVEDRPAHILSVNREMESLSIPCQSFHYVGATFSQEEVSPEVVQYQFQHLLKTKKWLSDSEVKKRLEKSL